MNDTAIREEPRELAIARALMHLDRGDLDGAALEALDAERAARASGAALDRALATSVLAAIDTLGGRDGWPRIRRVRVDGGTPEAAIVSTLRAIAILSRGDRALPYARRMLSFPSLADRTFEGRLVRSIALRAIEARSMWRIAADGSFVDRPDGTRIVLAPRGLLMRLCARLATARIEQPGARVPLADLVAAGWPDERMIWRAAENRLRVALARLRSAGLEPILRSVRGGYLLDPDVALTVLANGGEGI